MKATGYVRHVDRLGRIGIPIKLLRSRKVERGKDMFSISVDGEKIILEKYKYKPTCAFCLGQNRTIGFNGKHVCQECMKAFARECADQEE